MIHRATSAEVLHSWTKGRDQPKSDPLVLQVGQTTLPHKNTNCYRNKKRCNLVPRGRDPFGRRRGSGFFRRMTKGTPGDEAGSVDNETTLTESVGQTAWRLFAPTGAMRRDDDGDKTLKQRTHLHHPNACMASTSRMRPAISPRQWQPWTAVSLLSGLISLSDLCTVI